MHAVAQCARPPQDNAILLIGGANQLWPEPATLQDSPDGRSLRAAIGESVAVMLQREVPAYVNAIVAQMSRRRGLSVFMDVGGTDAPLDESLMPYVSVIAPNESEVRGTRCTGICCGVRASIRTCSVAARGDSANAAACPGLCTRGSRAEAEARVPELVLRTHPPIYRRGACAVLVRRALPQLTFVSGVSTLDEHGAVSLTRVRAAVTALRARFATAGNPSIEVLVTLGSRGSLHFGADWSADARPAGEATSSFLPDETPVGAYRLATADGKPVDTTGAGDCFRGSYVAARYGELKSVAEAMRWAAAAGSLCVEVMGAMPSMPTRLQIEGRYHEAMAELELAP